MKKDKLKTIRFLKILVIITCIAAGVLIGFYKFPRQNVTLITKTDTGKITTVISAGDLKALQAKGENGELFIPWEGTGATTFTQIEVYRLFKSIAVGEILESSFHSYGAVDETGITLNSAGIALLCKYSTNYLMERMLFAEIVVAFAIFAWIIINAIGEKIDPDNRDNHGPIYELGMFFKNLKKYWQYITYSAKADLNAEVANSYLNRLWWILEPMCSMLVYVIVFGRVMGNSIQNFATFVFSALLMWNYFSHVLNYSVKCVRFNRDIVTKIYVPKYVLLLSNMALNFMKLLFSLIVLVVMLFIFKVKIGLCIFYIIPAYILMILISFSAGMIMLHYGVFVDDLAYAVSILLQMLMFLSGIFYNVVTALPYPLNNMMMCLNPVAMFVDSMRGALLNNEIRNVPIMIVWYVLAILVGYIGIHIVNKNENGYVKVI